MTDSEILWQAYDRFFLNLGGKRVPTPYRLNIPYQTDLKKCGKSSPEVLTQDVIEVANDQNFDLNHASIEEIRNFMKSNLLGIDCSGYVYHCLDYLLNQLSDGGLEKAGLPPASRTNVKVLAQDQFSVVVDNISQIKPGDFITFKNGPHGHAHVLLIMEASATKIIYTQSSGLGNTRGVQQTSIKILDPKANLKKQQWDETLANNQGRVDYFQPELGDGVRRLKALQNHEQT